MSDFRRESDIQREIVRMLRASGWLVYRMNSGKVKVRGGWIELAPIDTPDLLAFRTDMPVHWFECKTERGKLTAGQQQQHEILREYGHVVAVVRSIDDVVPYCVA